MTGSGKERVGMEDFELLKVLGTGGERPLFFVQSFVISVLTILSMM